MQFQHDLLYSLRQMRKTPGFALVVILTLALTVGLTATVFSVLDAVFLRPLPYRNVSRIFALRTYSPQGYTQPASYPEYVDWRAVSLRAVATTANFFQVFGLPPAIGRTFQPGEDDPGRNNVVVLSNEVWRSLFGGRREAVGSTLKIEGRIYTVIGVMPPGFRFPINRTDPIYFPLNMTDRQRSLRAGMGAAQFLLGPEKGPLDPDCGPAIFSGMVLGMATAKLTITLAENQLSEIRSIVAAGKASSVSAFVQHAVGVALHDAAGWREMLKEALQQTGGPLTSKERAWADELLNSPKKKSPRGGKAA